MAEPTPLFLQVFPEFEDLYYKAQERAEKFEEYHYKNFENKGDSIDKKYIPILMEINELGFFTTNSQSGFCEEEENPLMKYGPRLGEPILGKDGIKMIYLKEEQRAYLEGVLPKKIFYHFFEKINTKYPNKFEFVKLGEDGTKEGEYIPLTQYKYKYEDGTEKDEIYSVSPGYLDIEKEYKYFNKILSKADFLSYGGGVEGLIIDDKWMIFEIHSIDFCLDALDKENGLFVIVRNVLKEVLEKMLKGPVAAGGGGAESGGSRKSRRRRQRSSKKLTRRRRTKAKSQI